MATLGAAPIALTRYAAWTPLRARLGLALLGIVAALCLLVPIDHSGDGGARPGIGAQASLAPARAARFDDLAMYERVITRLQHGEAYYEAVVAEHRLTRFPLRPGLAVRLPTLAWLSAWAGQTGLAIAAWVLFLAVPFVWWRKLGEELPTGPESGRLRVQAVLLVLIGMSICLTPLLRTLHEVWAGALLALSFGLHRGGKWAAALIIAALALAIRELALPYVLLMGATAFCQRDWKQAAAWTGLAAVFLAGLAVHLHTLSGLVLPGDLISPSWLTFRGPSGWLSNLILPSQLLLLPEWLAKLLVVAALFGWASWRSAAGAFGALLLLGYGLFFMIAGRDENHYWGAMVAPLLFIGLAFAPRGGIALWRAANVRKFR
jgi:hypothetical protein